MKMVNSMVLGGLFLFFIAFILFNFLGNSISIETMYERGPPRDALQQPVNSESRGENPYLKMEVSIDNLNSEVEKMTKKISVFENKISYLETQVQDAKNKADDAKNIAVDANNKVTKLTNSMAGGA